MIQPDNAIEDLTNYLLNHENDIAIEMNDFGDLRYVFEGCIGRLPLTDQEHEGVEVNHA